MFYQWFLSIYFISLISYSILQGIDIFKDSNELYKLNTFQNTLESYAKQPLDLVFLLDESGSLGSIHYETEKDFIEIIARTLNISASNTRTALVSFASYTRLHFNYLSRTDGDACNFMRNLKIVDYASGGTDTEAGLYAAEKVFAHSRPKAKKVIMLLSNGQSNHEIATIAASRVLKNKGIIIFCVGIAGAVERELLAVSSGPQYLYIISKIEYVKQVYFQIRQDIQNVALVQQPKHNCQGQCDTNAGCYCGNDGKYECACNIGYMGSGEIGFCTKCPYGTYNSMVNQIQCMSCPPNSNTTHEAAISESECKCLSGYIGNSCMFSGCPELHAPIGGNLEPKKCGTSLGDKCSFWCDKGYCPHDSSEEKCLQEKSKKIQKPPRICLITGKWTGTPFKCEENNLNQLIDCEFEYDTCNWTNTQADGYENWIINNYYEKTSNYLPTAIFENYIYAQIFDKVHSATKTDVKFALISPLFSTEDQLCFTFDYFKFGPNNGDLTLHIDLQENQSKISKFIWKSEKYSIEKWHTVHIQLNSTYTIFRLRLETIINYATVIAVKNVHLSTSKCIENDKCDFTTDNCGRFTTPGACNFDDGFCGYTNVNNNWGNWMVGRGITYEAEHIKRPDSDANGNGLYAYVDYTYGIMPKESTTELRSETIQVNQRASFCLSFSYVMYGDSISKLEVLLTNKTRNNNDLLLEINSQSQNITWQREKIDFYSSYNFQIIFRTKNVRSVATFVAIDAVTITPGRNCTEPDDRKYMGNIEKHICNFEPINKCQFWNLESHQNHSFNDWEVSNGLNSDIDGPNFDFIKKSKKGYYLVADNAENARISTYKTIKSNKSICLQFWVTSYGESFNNIQVISISKNMSEDILMNNTIYEDDKWQISQVEIINKRNNKIVIQSEITQHNKSRGFLAIDDVVITPSACSGTCTFENGMCEYTQVQKHKFLWKLTNSDYKPFAVDHTTNTTSGIFLDYYFFNMCFKAIICMYMMQIMNLGHVVYNHQFFLLVDTVFNFGILQITMEDSSSKFKKLHPKLKQSYDLLQSIIPQNNGIWKKQTLNPHLRFKSR